MAQRVAERTGTGRRGTRAIRRCDRQRQRQWVTVERARGHPRAGGAAAQLKLSNPQAIRINLANLKKTLEKVRDEISKLTNAISASQADTIKKQSEELTKYEQAVEAATQLAFAEIELDGVGTPVWQELIRTAAKYSVELAYPGKQFPATEEGAKCVLCQQLLDQKAQDRLKRFWEFIQDEVSTKRDKAKEALDLERQRLMNLSTEMPQVLEALLEPLRASGSKIPEEVESYFPLAAKRIASLANALANDTWESLAAEPASPSCDLEIKSIDETLVALADNGTTAELMKSLSREINELKSRSRLKDSLPTVLDYVRSLKRSKSLLDAANKINTKPITKTANELNKKFVTDEFKKGVQDQLAFMGLTSVKAGINEKPHKGKVLHKITVEDAPTVNPEDVFSEGERTAVALACFVAELTANKDNCAIILDDPVSSLDHRVREGVAKLLVLEASKRQVIIFTHDLVFYRELLSLAMRQGVAVTFQHIQALGDKFGLVSDTPPWYAMTVGQRITLLEKTIADARVFETAGNTEAYRSRSRDFYSILHSTWERSVEELLFNSVVQRLEPDIATMRLREVSIDEEAIEAVFDGMSRTSPMIDAHDPAMAKGKPLATSADLQKDLQELRNFKIKQEQKMSDTKKKFEHLKKSKAGKQYGASRNKRLFSTDE